MEQNEICAVKVEAEADDYSSEYSRKISLNVAYDGKYGWDAPSLSIYLPY